MAAPTVVGTLDLIPSTSPVTAAFPPPPPAPGTAMFPPPSPGVEIFIFDLILLKDATLGVGAVLLDLAGQLVLKVELFDDLRVVLGKLIPPREIFTLL